MKPSSHRLTPALAALWFAAPLLAFPNAGLDAVDAAAVLRLNLRPGGGSEQTVTAFGAVRIRREDPATQPDGRTLVRTEIAAVALRGSSPEGAAVIRESPLRRSRGQVVQQTPGADFPADSFFDLFLEIETPQGVLTHHNPVRLEQAIEALPPVQTAFRPEDGFAPVELFTADGASAGVLRDMVLLLGPSPSFSVAREGASGLASDAIFDAPAAERLNAGSLGLMPGGDIDGLSFGNDWVRPVADVRFSVDAETLGAPGTAVRDKAGRGEASGDAFRVTSPSIVGGDNRLFVDEDGGSAPRFGLPAAEDVNALAGPPVSFVDPDGAGAPERPVYFSLRSGSPALAERGLSPADILVSTGAGPPPVFRSSTELGLIPSDDVDAFCLDAARNRVLFSLAPGSPTLLAAPAMPGDLFLASGPDVPRPPPVFAPAARLGLSETDNADALDCAAPELDFFFEAELRAEVQGETVVLRGPATLAVGVGPNGEAEYFERRERDEAPVEVIAMELAGETSFGEVRVRVRSAEEPPFEASLGSITEGRNRRGGLLDLPPFSSEGSAGFSVRGFFEVAIGGEIFHHAAPVVFEGSVTRKPPRLGESLPAAQPVELVDEQGRAAGVSITNAVLTLNSREPGPLPEFRREGLVSAASFAPGAAAGAIQSLFGAKLAESVLGADGVPLPEQLGGTSLRIEDSQGAARPAPLFFVAPGQINFLIPPETAPGPAVLTVETAAGRTSSALDVSAVAPALFSANANGRGVAAAQALTVAADGGRSTQFVFDPQAPLGERTGVPLDPGEEGTGVFLTLFGTGIRNAGGVLLEAGGLPVQVFFAGPQGRFVGLDQINAGPLPRELAGQGEVELVVTADGRRSNAVTVTIE